jgi:hypothetical protein
MSDLSARLDKAQEVLQELGAGPVRKRLVIRICYTETVLHEDGTVTETQVPARYPEPKWTGRTLPDGSEACVLWPLGDPDCDEPEVTQ